MKKITKNWYKKQVFAQNKDLFADNSWKEDLVVFLRSYLSYYRQNEERQQTSIDKSGDWKSDQQIYMEGYRQWIRKKVGNKYKLMDGSLDPRVEQMVADFLYENFGFDPMIWKGENKQEEIYEADIDETNPQAPINWKRQDPEVPTAQELEQQWGEEEPPTPSVQELEDWPVLKEKPKR